MSSPLICFTIFSLLTTLLCLLGTTLASKQLPDLKILPRGPKTYAPEKKPFLLTCSGANQEPTFFTNLQWINPKGEVISEHNAEHRQNYRLSSRSNSLQLSFMNPSESLSGNYSCTGYFQNVDQLQDRIEVTFFQDITWEDCPTNQVLVKGQKNAMIRCKVTSKPPADVSWTHNDRSLRTNRYFTKFQGLFINGEVDDDLQGAYDVQAQVSETGHIDNQRITVEVHVLPEITHVASLKEIIEDEEARLTCRASGVPMPNYYWLDGNKQNLTTMGGYVVNHATGDLIIQKVRKLEDSGEFTCVAENGAGRSERRLSMDIITRPRIVSFHNTSYLEKGPATLLCEATGRPAPALTIRKDFLSGPLQSGGRYMIQESHDDGQSALTLTIRDLRREDDGLYYCIASNKAAEVNTVGHLQVEYPPDLSRTSKTVMTWSDRPVNISCVVNAIPNATVSWAYRNQPVIEDANHVLFSQAHAFEDYGLVSRLIGGGGPGFDDQVGVNNLLIRPTAQRPLASLLGVYQCLATNRHGTRAVDITLSEARRPASPSPPDMSEDSPTTIRVRFTPPIHNGGLPLRRLHVRYRENMDPIHAMREHQWPADQVYLLENLRPRAQYSLSFAFENDVGIGDWSEEFVKKMPVERAPDPPRLTVDFKDIMRPVQSLYADRFDVRWAAPNDNGRPIDTYLIKYYPAVRSFSNWHRVGDIREHTVSASDQLVFHLTSLTANTTYQLELFARNSEGYSSPALLVFHTGRRVAGLAAFQQSFGWLHTDLRSMIIVVAVALLFTLIIADIVLYTRYDYGALYFLTHRMCTERSNSHKAKAPDTANTGYSYHSPNDEVYPMMVDPNTRNELRAELEHRLRMPKFSAV